MDDAVDQCVCYSFVVERIKPNIHWHLAGEEKRPLPRATIDQLQQIVLGTPGDRLNSPVVEDQQVELLAAWQRRGYQDATAVLCVSQLWQRTLAL